MRTRIFRPGNHGSAAVLGPLEADVMNAVWLEGTPVTVADVMHRGRENPTVRMDRSVREALQVMTKTRMGATSVIDRNGRLVGYFTDGDFRRLAQRDLSVLTKTMDKAMTPTPHVLSPETKMGDAAQLLRRYRCDNMPVVDSQGRPIGLLDERDLLSEGLM